MLSGLYNLLHAIIIEKVILCSIYLPLCPEIDTPHPLKHGA